MFSLMRSGIMVEIKKKSQMKIKELIIMIMRQRSKPASTHEMAETLGRSWEFVYKLLNAMSKDGVLKRLDYGKGHYWALK